MGQKFGKAKLVSAADPFVNLPKKAIQHTWQMFNDIADGFGISKEELEEICADIKDDLNISRLTMMEFTSSLFEVLDTDQNGLIDALEFIGTISSISGMRLHEILDFVLKSYDFDGTGHLSVDEVTLSLKSLSSGLCKLELSLAPKEEKIEHLVSTMFTTLRELNNEDSMNFRITVLVEYLSSQPDIKSWYSHFEISEVIEMKKYVEIPQLQKFDVYTDGEHREIYGSNSTIEWELCAMSYEGSKEKEKEKDGLETAEVPWRTSVPLLVPLQYANTDMSKTAPEMSMEVSWVYGYQSEKARNNVAYTAQGSIVYHVGRFAVVYSLVEHSQVVFTVHTHEITALVMHPSGMFVATADCGPSPRLVVWNALSLEVLFTDNTMFQKGLSSMTFSYDGKLLAAVGNDVDHSVFIFKWETNEILYSSLVSPHKCLACCFRQDGVFAAGGDTYMYFWYHTDEGFLKRAGVVRKHVPIQPITCLVQSKNADSLISGTILGQLFLWVERNCVRNVHAHDGPINAMYSSEHGLLSGGDDHRIRLWSHRLEPAATFDLGYFGILPQIRGVNLSADGTSITFGTLGGNIFEISAIDGSDLRGGPIACAHFTGKMRCVATHPSKHEFITVGDDKQLRIWDMKSHTLLKIASFDGEVRAVAYGPLGDIIAVGLGGEKTSNGKSGAFVILSEDDLSVLHEARDSATPITLVCFSPEGETLAVACEDGPVYLYAVQDEYELIGRCVRHTTAVKHLDFSIDGEWIRTNSLSKDIGFFNADDASYQSNLASMRDIQWFTQSCIYSWHVKSVHRTPFADDTVTTLHAPTPTSDFLACGTSTGYIRLHSFPCIPEDSECQRFQAHAGPVCSARFSFCGHFLISTGTLDRCIVLWAVKPERSDYGQAQSAVDIPESDDYRSEARESFDVKDDFMAPRASAPPGAIFGASVLHKGADSVPGAPSAVDTWLGQVVPPSNLPVVNPAIPDVSLKLTYVHGFRSQDMRSQVCYNSDGDVIFVSSSFGVAMSKSTGAQTFYKVFYILNWLMRSTFKI